MKITDNETRYKQSLAGFLFFGGTFPSTNNLVERIVRVVAFVISQFFLNIEDLALWLPPFLSSGRHFLSSSLFVSRQSQLERIINQVG